MREDRARPRRPIDAGYLRFVLSGAEQAGLDTRKILTRANVDPNLLGGARAQIPQEDFARLITTLTKVTRDEFWLICGRPIKLGTFNTMCRLIVQCGTLGSALRMGFRFYHQTVDDFTLRLSSSGRDEVAKIWVTTKIEDATRRRMVCGATLFFAYGMMCWLVGRRLPLHSVHYAFVEHPFSSELVPYYDAPIFFNQTSHELRFQRELLDLPIMPDEERLRRFFQSMPSALLVRYRDETSFSERVRAVLRRNLRKHISLEEVADRLGVSMQTLRRRLVESACCRRHYVAELH